MPNNLRRPRFSRATDIPAMQLTTRDVYMMRHVAQNRFLRSTHLVALVGGSRQPILRRLRSLYHHGWLDRPRCQVDRYRAGSQPMVYGIGNRGAKMLADQCGISRRKVDWTAKNHTVTRYFLEHTLAVADVAIALELSCRKRPNIEVRADETDTKWKVSLKQHGSATHFPVIPDKVFRIDFRDKPGAVIYLLLELDRATMPVARHTLKQTSVYRKLVGYQQIWREKLHEKFGMKRIRVLTVTTTAQRMMNLVEAAQHLPNPTPGLFLFASKSNLAFNQDPFAARVVNGTGEEVMLTA
jgi:hypothetical protein